MRPTRLAAVALAVSLAACVTDLDPGKDDETVPLLDGKADALALTPEGILQPTNTRALLVGESQGYTFYGAPGAKVTLTMVAAKPGCGRSTTRLDPFLYVWDANGK